MYQEEQHNPTSPGPVHTGESESQHLLSTVQPIEIDPSDAEEAFASREVSSSQGLNGPLMTQEQQAPATGPQGPTRHTLVSANREATTMSATWRLRPATPSNPWGLAR